MRSALTLIVCIFLAGIVILGWQGISFLNQAPADGGQEIIFEVSSGSSLSSVANRLQQQGLVTDSFKFILFAKLTGEESSIKVGEYILKTDMTPRTVLNILSSGLSIKHDIVIPEGFNIFEIRDLLNTKWPGRGDEFFNIVTDKSKVQSLLKEEHDSLEGFLFPDTYQLTKYTSMSSLVDQMHSRFLETMASLPAESKIKMSLYDQVTLASVIEKETGAVEERQKISAVFHNRLKKRMRLQSDPTIIYGMAQKSGTMTKNIKREDILNPTPFNTYTVPALPVGPIANPGRDALIAALNPEEISALFFVSKNDGTHVFTEKLQDHNRAVKDFQLNKSARDGKSWRDLKKNSSSKKNQKIPKKNK